jgi:hypothetical protein
MLFESYSNDINIYFLPLLLLFALVLVTLLGLALVAGAAAAFLRGVLFFAYKCYECLGNGLRHEGLT